MRKQLEIQIQLTMSERYKIKHWMGARNKTIFWLPQLEGNAILCLYTHLSFYRCFIIVVSKYYAYLIKQNGRPFDFSISKDIFENIFYLYLIFEVNTSHVYARLHFQIIQRTEMNIIVIFSYMSAVKQTRFHTQWNIFFSRDIDKINYDLIQLVRNQYLYIEYHLFLSS